MALIIVNGNPVEAHEGATVLEACLSNGIFIPNLCFLKERDHPHASCRLCFVEVEGYAAPVPSCTLEAKEGLKIRTDTPEVRRLQIAAFKLIMSGHPCHAKTCPTVKPCLLMRIAKHLGVGLSPKPYPKLERDVPDLVDFGVMYHVPIRCVLCGRCVFLCRQRNGKSLLTFARRGIETMVALFPEPGTDLRENCQNCRACVNACPTAALIWKE
ncbi:2Fe-2S iron-sulfur cluster-binding protein [Thermodesulforhabdus norvegica]|uniref:Formate dehydrogenase major subunit n=1 Tax=Thermodesulforhabdus norvegica TaxID=39841 RepID=A0A1I4SMB1_9BACT|nr:2Fe-2S iron-sulfur cluster-binding protein [Thermodesulforhabdus norvegica]SFM65490.1 formate dehydrogenase major subunit [Thermodesulforhabdus norvegica]